MAQNKWQHGNKHRQKENVPENPQNSCLTKSDEEALRIHGISFENGGYSSESDSGRSFDEEYYKNKPKPLKITRTNTITIKKISSNNEQPELVNVYNADIRKDTSAKTYYQPPVQNFPVINRPLPLHQNLNEPRANQIISQNFKENVQNVAKIPTNTRNPRENVTNWPPPETHRNTQGTTLPFYQNLNESRTYQISPQNFKGNVPSVAKIPTNIRNPRENVPNLPTPGTHRITQGTTYAGTSNVPTKVPKTTSVNATGTRNVLQSSTGIRSGGNMGSNQRSMYNVPKIPGPGVDVINSRAHSNTQNAPRISDLPKVVTKVPNSIPKSNTRNSAPPQDILRPSSSNNSFNFPAQRSLHDEAQRNVSEQTSDTYPLCEDEESGSFCGSFLDCLLCRKC